jgi:hypothetical protein
MLGSVDNQVLKRLVIIQAFCREAFIWQSLKHPFVLPFLGVDAESFPSSLSLVTPWTQNGTILEHLQGEGPLRVDVDRCVGHFILSQTAFKLRHIFASDFGGCTRN